jgi:hypothetical protein
MAFDPISLLLEVGNKVMDRVWPDPAQASQAKMELAKMAQSGELAKMANDTETMKAYLADTASARDREAKIATSPEAPYLNKVIVPCLAIGILAASFVVFGLLLFVKVDPAHKDILIYVLGVLSAICSQVTAYFFGSSAGSTAKDQTIKRVLGGLQ